MTPFRLRPRERRQLLGLSRFTPDARQLRRAQALLWLDEGRPAAWAARLLRVRRQTVYNWARHFRERGDRAPPARLLDAPRGGRPATASGVIDPLIAAVIGDDPRAYGYRHTAWTAGLLRQHLAEAHGLRTSPRSVGRALARLGLRWKRPRHRLARRPATWRQAKGGSSAACAAGGARRC
jgi:transposase